MILNVINVGNKSTALFVGSQLQEIGAHS